MRFVASGQAAQGHQYDGVREDDIALEITVWLPGHRSEADPVFRVVPWPESGTPQPRHFTVCCYFFIPIAITVVISPLNRVYRTKRGKSLHPIAMFAENLI